MSFSTWSEGYFMQAKQDFALVKYVIEARKANRLLDTGISPSAFGASLCMLLQMFFEKYSKACFCRWNHDKLPPRNHKSVRLLIQFLKRSNNVNYSTLSKPGNLDICYNIMQELENLQPSNANAGRLEDCRPQLEYPWRNNTSASKMKCICAPATDLPLAREIDNSTSRFLCVVLKFAERLIIDFNRLASSI